MTLIVISLISSVFALFIIYYNWKRRHWYKLAWSLNGPYSYPIIGDAFKLLLKNEEILEFITKNVFNKYPSPIKFWFGPKLTVIFTEMKQVEKVMSSLKFVTKDEVYKFIQVFNGEGLISGSGPKWKRDRRLISPLLINKEVEKYFPQCENNTEILINKLKVKVDQPTFNLEIYIHRCAADMVNEALVGTKVRAQDGNFDEVLHTIREMYILTHARIAKVWLQNEFIFKLLGYKKVEKRGLKVIHGFFQQCIDHVRDHRVKELNNAETNITYSILSKLLHINDQVPNFATDLQLVHHLSTMYTAAEDTITIICSFASVLFGMYPEVQNKAYEELTEVFGSKPREIKLEDLSKLNYLRMCVNDVLRLFPIAPFIMREASEECIIDKWTLPKGCSIMISIYNIHRSEEHWEKPTEFYPEHFLPEAVQRRHLYAFMPFSAGPRGCIGKPYAYMAILTILASILQNFQLESDGTLEDRKLKSDITIRFKDGYPVRLKQRS